MFIQLKSDEKIVSVLRRHWLIITFHFLRIFPLFFLPLFIRLVAGSLIDFYNPLFSVLFWLASIFWWSFLWSWAAVVWVDYYLDVWIITDQRIIDVRQKGLFKREVAELTLLKIQDITIKVRGAIRTFLHFGDLEIRTAGTFESDQESNIFVFKDIPQPAQVQNFLSRLHQDYLKRNVQHV